MELTLIFTTDPWHSISSREIIAIATTERQRDRLIKKYLRECLYVKIDKDTLNTAMEEIRKEGQTQSLSKHTDFEIDTETTYTNVILS